MVAFGGKKVRQMVAGIGGNGLGQVLAAVAVTLLVRLFSGPGPVLLPETEDEDHVDGEEKEDVEEREGPVSGQVLPVAIRWSNITCSLSDKSSKSVSCRLRILCHFVNAELLFVSQKLGYLLRILCFTKP